MAFDRSLDVVIHVTDDNRNITRDVICNRKLLVDGMEYFKVSKYESGLTFVTNLFQAYLTTNYEEVDIAVHCDINIFEWLIKYLKSKPGSEPKLSKRALAISC